MTWGEDSPWKPLFKNLEAGTRVRIKLDTRETIEGYYEDCAVWEDLNEVNRYEGITVGSLTANGVTTWIPFSAIDGVHL